MNTASLKLWPVTPQEVLNKALQLPDDWADIPDVAGRCGTCPLAKMFGGEFYYKYCKKDDTIYDLPAWARNLISWFDANPRRTKQNFVDYLNRLITPNEGTSCL